MANPIVMPKLGLTMTEGLLVSWLVREGAEVTKGQPIAEIETEKATVEVESPANGILGRIVAPEGETVPVAEVIAWVTAPGEAAPELSVAVHEPREQPRVTPNAKRLAAELGVDLGLVTGTGPDGVITGDDVQALVKSARKAEQPAAPTVTPVSGIRKIIAERMSKSHVTAAEVTLFTEVDATAFVELREKLKTEASQRGTPVPSYNDLLIKAVAAALREYPYMNAAFTEAGIERHEHVNVALAVDTERGLFAPVVRDADRKEITDIAGEVRSLAERARAGNLKADDMSGGTFTITNLGMYGIDGFTPIINLPQCAVLGVGRIIPKPVVKEGRVEIRQCVVLSLTFDHRLTDGAPAARFLQRVASLIEEPAELGR